MAGKMPGFATTIISIGMLEYAMVVYHYPKGNNVLNSIIFFLIAGTFALLIFKLTFLWVAIHTAIGIIFFLGMPFSIRILKGTDKVGFFFWGFISMLITLPIELFKLNLNLWFQHQDISHILMIFTLYFFLRVSIKLNYQISIPKFNFLLLFFCLDKVVIEVYLN